MRNCSSQQSAATHYKVAAVCVEAHRGGFGKFARARVFVVRSTRALENMGVLFLQLLKHFGAVLRLLQTARLQLY